MEVLHGKKKLFDSHTRDHGLCLKTAIKSRSPSANKKLERFEVSRPPYSRDQSTTLWPVVSAVSRVAIAGRRAGALRQTRTSGQAAERGSFTRPRELRARRRLDSACRVPRPQREHAVVVVGASHGPRIRNYKIDDNYILYATL